MLKRKNPVIIPVLKNGSEGRIRTFDLRVMSPTSYQLLYLASKISKNFNLRFLSSFLTNSSLFSSFIYMRSHLFFQIVSNIFQIGVFAGQRYHDYFKWNLTIFLNEILNGSQQIRLWNSYSQTDKTGLNQGKISRFFQSYFVLHCMTCDYDRCSFNLIVY